MADPRLLRALTTPPVDPSEDLGCSRSALDDLAHLWVMKSAKTKKAEKTKGVERTGKALEREPAPSALSIVEGVLSLSELCAQLQVSPQTIYDLRSQGRGPRGFRVGRELRFRMSEIDSWLSRLESEDDRRHHPGRR